MNTKDMLAHMRGGWPEKCDFCGGKIDGPDDCEPEEGGSWACRDCWESWQDSRENYNASPEDGARCCPELSDLVVSVSARGSNFTAPRPRDSLRCHHCPELPGQIHRGGGVYSLCPPCNGTGYINPENAKPSHP